MVSIVPYQSIIFEFLRAGGTAKDRKGCKGPKGKLPKARSMIFLSQVNSGSYCASPSKIAFASDGDGAISSKDFLKH